MILSAVALWKKYNTDSPLREREWGLEIRNRHVYTHVQFSGHCVEDGETRIYARFGEPFGTGKKPAVLFLPDVGESCDEELMGYFIDRGYAVLVPDYCACGGEEGSEFCTTFPPSLAYANFKTAKGVYDLKNLETEKTAWFEWTYVALYAIKYLQSRRDIGNIGVVGVRKGGEIAWQTMLSPDVKCGVPINAVGWRSFLNIPKFNVNEATRFSDEERQYIAGIEAQSYAPYVQCPVLMLCALRDHEFDCDRAYDTYSRIGNEDGNALLYSLDTGACIGPNGLTDMDLFLEKNLKGREIYLPATLNVVVEQDGDELDVRVECDKEGILEETGVFYAESKVTTKSPYRDWHRIFKAPGRTVKDGVAHCRIKPFSGADAGYVYAYAKYINGFRVTSKIVCKRLANPNPNAVRSHHLFGGTEMDCFSIAEYQESAIGGIFLEKEAIPKTVLGYGGIHGAYSVGGIRTYKISSPRYVPEENAFLSFDVYSKTTQDIQVSIEVANVETEEERYVCEVEVKGGGKWKRIILKPVHFKGEKCGYTLENFYHGSALVFNCAGEEKEFSVTNIIWL